MNRSVLIMGCSDSRHVYNFINIVLSDPLKFDHITIFNVAYVDHEPKEFDDYYKTRNIRVLNPSKKPSTKIGAFNSALNFAERTWALHKHLKSNHYDYLIVHYCSWQAMNWVNLFGNSFQKIFLVFYGGDVLRNKSVNNQLFNSAYQKASAIILPNKHSYDVFNTKTQNRYEDKATLIQFPKKMVSTFLELEDKLPPRNAILERFGFPKDKIIVLCGHTATRAERYEQIISQIKMLPDNIRDKCFWAFMMTYAPEEYETYQREIETSILNNHIHGCVMKEYLNYVQIQELHSVTSIHVTNILTDALSAFLQEQMLSGSIIIYGKWLHYDDIENENFFALPYNHINDLSGILIEVINDLDNYTKLSVKNRNGIINLASEQTVKNQWNDILNID